VRRIACLLLSCALLGLAPTALAQPSPVAPAAASPATPASSAVAPAPAKGAPLADPLFPPEMLADLKLADPAWAQLAPAEQVRAIRNRLEQLGRNDPAVPALQWTIAWLYDRRIPENALEAASEYHRMQSHLMAAEPYRFAGQALLRGADIYLAQHKQRPEGGYAKRARQSLNGVAMAEQRSRGNVPLWEPKGATWVPSADPYGYVLARIDGMCRDQTMYRVIHFLVRLTGGIPGWSQVLALLTLALLLNVATYPLSRKSYRSMREMQRVQPLLQEAQRRHKDNPQRQQQEIMAIYKEHGVNPFAGCLPMFIQMPVFIFVYQGIQAYTLHFHKVHFLWMRSLAEPDTVLLVLYGLSMYVSQKLMMSGQPTPTDPAQAQTQRTMSWMMPLMFTYMMYMWRLPSAFYFYWMAFNVFSTTGQMLSKRSLAAAEADLPLRMPAGPDPAAELRPKDAPRPVGKLAGKAKRKRG